MPHSVNHIYLIGYWVGQLEILLAVQLSIHSVRTLCPDDQKMQLDLDRQQTALDKQLAVVQTALFEIPRSN